MKFLVVEDDLISRNVLQKFLAPYGECSIAVDGREAIDAFKGAVENKKPFDLICMDIMMPNIDGMQAVKEIRDMEVEMGINILEGVKIIMISAVENPRTIFEAIYKKGAFGYLNKPVSKMDLVEELKVLGLIQD